MKNFFINLIARVSNWVLLVCVLIFNTDLVKAQSSGCFTSGSHSSNRIDYKTIIPCGAKKITLTFSYFKVSSTGSLLKIYDGTDASGKPLHPGSGFTYGNYPTNPLIAYSGALYLYFSTTGTNTDSFAACWTTELDTLPPVAKFEIQDTLINLVNYTFNNQSKSLAFKTDYTWRIYPDYGYVGFKKDLDFVFKTNKTYDVILKVSNCLGWDQYTKKLVVITPNYKVNLDFKAKNLQPFLKEIDTLSALNAIFIKRPIKADKFIWEFFPDKVTYVKGTSPNSPTIQVEFKEKGKYKVSLKAWNSSDSADSYNEVIKKDYINVKEHPSPKVYINPIAKNTKPIAGQTDTLFAIDSIPGKLFKANRFRWEFSPNTVTYLNGTSPDMHTIQVKFNEKGKYTVYLKGWNSKDSSLTFNDTLKTDYINVVPIPKVYLDFKAQNLKPKVGKAYTLSTIDDISDKPFKADRFRWEFSPNEVTYLNGTSPDLKVIQVKFNQKGKYTISLKGWNSTDSVASVNDTIKTDYITVEDSISPRIFIDFRAKNLKLKVGEVDTLFAIDSISGSSLKADRFLWEFLPDKVSYINGTLPGMQTIQVKFNEKGKYTVLLRGWNGADSIATVKDTIKTDYITVDESFISINKIYNSEIVTFYPNPSTGIIQSNAIQPTQIVVYDAMGKLIFENIYTNGLHAIDFSKKPCGVYIFKIRMDNQQVIKRVSIIRE